MIRVQVSAGLVESSFETGNKTQGLIEVLEGIPHGSKLAHVQYDKGYVSLYFTEPGRCDDRDINVVVRTIYPE